MYACMQCLLCNTIPNCMFSIQQIVVISCAKNSPAVKKGEAKNAQVHVHGVTKDMISKSGQESIYSIGTFVHSFSICFTLSHPASCTCVLAIYTILLR